MQRRITHEQMEEVNYKLKKLLREENSIIRELLELKKKKENKRIITEAY